MFSVQYLIILILTDLALEGSISRGDIMWEEVRDQIRRTQKNQEGHTLPLGFHYPCALHQLRQQHIFRKLSFFKVKVLFSHERQRAHEMNILLSGPFQTSIFSPLSRAIKLIVDVKSINIVFVLRVTQRM